tara:strand:- start:376 stop:705 length:330 start_codon:yes stop_codon:yes gene_type:complete
MKIGKYEFSSKKIADSKVKSLGVAKDEDGNEYPTHKHTLVHLGNIVLEAGEYDEAGEETKEPILSTKWHVDALWSDDDGHPYGWKSAAVDLSGNGVHSFLGLNYDSYKI